MSDPGSQLDTRTDPVLDDGDHDRFAHYVRKEDIVRSNVTGEPVMALCGKVWVPNRVPDGFPVCPACKEVMARLKNRGTN